MRTVAAPESSASFTTATLLTGSPYRHLSVPGWAYRRLQEFYFANPWSFWYWHSRARTAIIQLASGAIGFDRSGNLRRRRKVPGAPKGSMWRERPARISPPDAGGFSFLGPS